MFSEVAALSLPSKLNRKRKLNTGFVTELPSSRKDGLSSNQRPASPKRSCSYRSNCILTPSYKFWEKHRRSSLEPFRSSARAVNRRSYLQPWFSDQARDSIWREVSSPSLPRKEFQETERSGDGATEGGVRRTAQSAPKPNRGRALPLSYCPINGGADRIRTNNGALRSEVALISLPGNWSLLPDVRRPCGATRAARRSLRLRGISIGEKTDQSRLDRVSRRSNPDLTAPK